MTKRLLLATALVAFAYPAFAGLIGNEGSDNSINNNSGIANTGTINGSVLNNGAGSGSTNLSNTSHNTNTNVNTAVGGSAKSNASAAQSQKQSQKQGQFQAASSSVKGSGNSKNENSITVQAPKRNPVSTAYSAQLVAAEDTCMGSSSVGGQGVGFGLSVGSTWSDADCVRRKDARELHNMGFKPAAVALMCQNAAVAKAMATAGTPCAVSVEPAAGGSYGEAREDRSFQNGSRKN